MAKTDAGLQNRDSKPSHSPWQVPEASLHALHLSSCGIPTMLRDELCDDWPQFTDEETKSQRARLAPPATRGAGVPTPELPSGVCVVDFYITLSLTLWQALLDALYIWKLI